ncbi:MAG: GNAT family N-acetyltransferase [Actinomycetota bacterium]
MNTFPSDREADVVLRDGSTAHVRPIRPEDEPGMLAFLKGLSQQAVIFRFFSGGVNLESMARWSVDVDHRDRFGLVVTIGPGSRVAAHASYIRTESDRAEIGLEVADDFQGHGLGTILIGHLAEAAAANGIAVFEAKVLAENHRMIDVFREIGFPIQMRSEPGQIAFEFPTELTAEARERFEGREQTAAVAALRTFLAPRSVAVVGASRRRGTIGGEILHNLVADGFNGPVFPVNPKAEVVQSIIAYRSVEDVPGPLDLAVIVVPAAAVVEAALECARKGVRALVVISSGFAEVGEEGIERQRELLRVCRDSGMRLIGPNCMGILNTAPEVRLNATFAPTFPPHGRVGFLSQSGALGLAVMDYASTLGLGLSSFVSVGNKADISGNDLIQYWSDDEETDLILLYLESFGNPRKFARLARRIAREKPIVAVKSGRSQAGARATSSHTGALLQASDVTVDALFRQAGVVRTDTLAEMFDVATLLANQPAPAGNRVGILTNAGGPAILCADTCEASGLVVPPIDEDVRRQLAEFLPREASFGNPVDMIASASAEDYRRALGIFAASEGIDALVVIFIPPLVTRAEDAAVAIRAAVEELPRPIPVLCVFMSARGVPQQLRDERVRIPSYAFPEDAARALARAVAYGVWKATPEGRFVEYDDLRVDEAASVIAGALGDGPGWLGPEQVARILECYGLPIIESRIVRTAREAGRVAVELGGRVALKAVAPRLVHKTEAGAVLLGLEGPTSVEKAAREMRARIVDGGGEVDGFLIQPMAPSGVEMLVGVVNDAVFGPVVACGAGGTAVELLKDVRVRITPLTDRDAHDMIHSLSTYPLLDGYRGAPKADVEALEEVLLRVSSLVEAHPEIAEMDLNPAIVHPEGAVVVDARIRVDLAPPREPLGARRPL